MAEVDAGYRPEVFTRPPAQQSRQDDVETIVAPTPPPAVVPAAGRATLSPAPQHLVAQASAWEQHASPPAQRASGWAAASAQIERASQEEISSPERQQLVEQVQQGRALHAWGIIAHMVMGPWAQEDGLASRGLYCQRDSPRLGQLAYLIKDFAELHTAGHPHNPDMVKLVVKPLGTTHQPRS